MDFSLNISESTGVPVYLQIKEQMRKFIIEGGLSGGTLLPNIGEIATAAGVSPRTADLGLKELIKDGVCYRRPKRGTYVSDTAGITNKKKVICVLHPSGSMSDNSHLGNKGIYQGMMQEATSRGADILLSAGNVDSSIQFYNGCQDIIFQGVILTEGCPVETANAWARKYPSVRFVYANYYFKGFEESAANICGIFNDDFAGAYQMASVMAGKGHKKFAICSLRISDENYNQRIKGFVAGLEHCGIKVTESMICYDNEKFFGHYALGRKYAERLFADGARHPDAVMTVNDIMSKGIIDFLREKQLLGRIEVSGYDYIDPEAKNGLSFPTVSVDFESIGKKAVEVVCRGADAYPKMLRIMPQIIL